MLFEEEVYVDWDNFFLTVIDADSWMPEMYYSEVEEHIANNF